MADPNATTTVTYSPDRRLINITIETTEPFTWSYISGTLKSLALNLEKEDNNESSTKQASIHPAIRDITGNDTEDARTGSTPEFTEWYTKGNGAV